MNWSLKNDGEVPSVIDNPGEDILTDEQTWITRISDGSKQYRDIKNRQAALEEAGISNINALFDLGQDKAFYDYIFRHLKIAPTLSTNGDNHKHEIYEDFLAEFKAEMDLFQEYMRGTTNLTTPNGEREISQGGLITPEFMDFATSPNTQTLPLEIRKQFFTDIEAYRGAMVDGEITDEKICQMFQNYTGIGTGYRALQRSHLPTLSSQKVRLPIIRESMEYYNRMFALTYFTKKHPDIQNPYANSDTPIKDLNTTVQKHIAGGKSIWSSPFVSTSLDYRMSKEWARKFSAEYAKNAQHGVLFRSLLPREGMVITFGKKFEGLTATGFPFEYEALVASSLQPASITEIEIYDKNSTHSNPGLTAKKVELDGNVNIIIDDRRGEFVVQRTYAYDPNTARFVLSATLTTETPSTTPVPEPTPFRSHEFPDISHLIKKYSGGYKSPFFEEKLYFPQENYSFDKEKLYPDNFSEKYLEIPSDISKNLKENIIPIDFSIIEKLYPTNAYDNLIIKGINNFKKENINLKITSNKNYPND